MRAGILLLVLALTFSARGQKRHVLFVINDAAPVSHSSLSFNILKNHNFSVDSTNRVIHSRVGFCTFLNNDTARYRIVKRNLSQLGLAGKEVYPMSQVRSGYSPFTRPNMDALENKIEEHFDYVVTLNKVDILSRLGAPRVRFWFSIYDVHSTEVISGRHYCKYDIKDKMKWHAFIQVLWTPCEDFEERILTIIDRHQDGYTPGGKVLDTDNFSAWGKGYIITEVGDTLHGRVRYKNPYQVHFRLSAESPPRLLEANNVTYFKSGPMKFQKLFVHQISGNLGKSAFAEVISDGAIALYRVGHDEMAKYYIKRHDKGKEIRVRFTPDKKRVTNKHALEPVFSDNESLVTQLHSKKFGAKDLEKLVYMYNR